jgi:hypothetical protein
VEQKKKNTNQMKKKMKAHKKKKKIVPLVTLEFSNVTNGGSIGNVGIFQRY